MDSMNNVCTNRPAVKIHPHSKLYWRSSKLCCRPLVTYPLLSSMKKIARNRRTIFTFIIIFIFGLAWISTDLPDMVAYTVCTPFLSLSPAASRLRDLKILEAMGSRNVEEMVQPTKNDMILKPFPGPKRPFMVILITSLPDATERRDLIRSTWNKWAEKFNIRILFFLGLSKTSLSKLSSIYHLLTKENEMYGDIIVDDFQEDYYKLTEKTLRMFKWFLHNYEKGSDSPPKYLVKTDHDVFLNIPNLVSYLESVRPVGDKDDSTYWERIGENYFIGGHLSEKTPLDRNPCSKWYITPSFWSLGEDETYPLYLSGPLYVLSGNIVESIYNASFSVPLFPFEDVYVTGMVAKRILNLVLSSIPFIILYPDGVSSILKDQPRLGQAVAIHTTEAGQMSEIYRMISI